MDFDHSTETITPQNQSILAVGGTAGIVLPNGTSAQRSGTSNGTFRYNTSINLPEAYYGGAWHPAMGYGDSNFFYMFDDFLSTAAVTPYGELGWTSTVTGTASGSAESANGVDTTSLALGVQQLTTGTTTTGRCGFSLGNLSMVLGTGYHYQEWRVMIPTLSTAAQEYQCRIGFGNYATASGQGNDGVCFLYNRLGSGVNWQGVTRNNTTTTTTNLGNAVTAGQWVKLGIEINAAASSVGFYMSTSVGSPLTLAATVATNIPGNTRTLAPQIKIEKTAGTTARQINLDYFQHFYTLTNSR